MNLGKLLVAGKSIINGGREISYRANKRVYLPKFGSTPNPFQPGAETEAAPAPAPKAAPVAAKTQKFRPGRRVQPAPPPGPAS